MRVPRGTSGRYFRSVAAARFVLRKVMRIVDEVAKQSGLEPLEHHALVQIFGAREPLRVGRVAERLDVAPAFASKLVKALVTKGLVATRASPDDGRAARLRATPRGRALVVGIDRGVRRDVGRFAASLDAEQTEAALEIFALYVGKQERP